MQTSLLFLMPRVFFFFLKEGDNNKTEHMIVVGPRTGISRITNVKTYAVSNFDFNTHTFYLTFIFMTFNLILWATVLFYLFVFFSYYTFNSFRKILEVSLKNICYQIFQALFLHYVP